MTARDDFDRLLAIWLDESAGAGTPEYLDETLTAIGRLRQRPAWLSPWRWLPMQLTMRRVAVPRAIPYFALLALLLVVALLAVALAGSQRRLPQPFGRAATGLIAFDTNGDIHVANADGTGVRAFVATPATEHGATFSRDGTRLAYWSRPVGGSPQLRLVDANGATDLNLTGDMALSADTFMPAGSWSPDGTRLAFSSGLGDLYVIATDGSTPARRIGEPGLLRSSPAWSPTGDWIAFRGLRSGPFEPPAVYVIRPDGTGETRVSGFSGGVNAMLNPDWSPDGASLLYDAVYDAPLGADESGEIIVATLDGSSWTERVVVERSPSWMARFSNDGTQIAFLRCRVQECVGAGSDVYVVGTDGSGLERVSDEPVGVAPPCWMPDDRAIVALTGDVTNAIENQASARYVVLPLVDAVPRAEIAAPGIVGVAACSWQRLAP
ncbi:MAG: hypothetical protein AB1627_13380 [Chloroflexota bacterium]